MLYHRISCAVALVVLLTGIFAGCGGGGGAAPLTGRVEGYVYISTKDAALTTARSDNRAAEGAEVRVQGTALQTGANAEGYFNLDGVPAGPRTLVIAYPGYQSLSVTVTVAGGGTVNINDTVLSRAPRRWTVLVFLNADNDLERFGMEDVNEMESVPDNEQVAVVAQMDRARGYDTTDGDWTGTKRLLIRHDENTQAITSPVLEEMGEVDMGAPAALHDFIAWGKRLYPAEHYLLVIWNHGSGWRSRAEQSPATRGVSFDDTSGSFIKTVDLPAALATSPPLDLIAFDASLMQMLEIAYEMRDSCRYLIGSEESPPGAGYAYHTWLGPLVANPAMPPLELAQTIARETLNYYGNYSDITHSVLDTARLGELAGALDLFAKALIPVAGSNAQQLASARDAAESFAYTEYKDLYHYAALVKDRVSNAQARSAADGVMLAVKRAVLAEYHGDYHPNAHGVSIYVPVPTGYARTAAQYTPLALSRDTNWNEWLGKQAQ